MDSFEPESQAAVKGAIVATTKDKWQPGEKLSATARLQDGRSKALELDLKLADFDGAPQVQISVAPQQKSSAEPTKLVHDALKRDPTTLFFHRAQFLERINKRLAKKPASGLHVLVYIKPDEFSAVAAQTGLIASEDVLGQFAEEVRKRLHPRDVAGRFEGTVLDGSCWNAATSAMPRFGRNNSLTMCRTQRSPQTVKTSVSPAASACVESAASFRI